jgi:RNA polymerase sigma factor (sigma-70 family)
MLRIDHFDTTDVSDGQLLVRLRQGHDDSFAELVGRHRAAAMAIARRALPGDAASAEDAVEDAIAATWRAIRNGNGPDADFRPYFLAATRTAALRISGRRLPTASSTDVLATDGSEYATVEAAHELSVLNECFHRLRPAWRQVLWQVDVDGVPSPAVADQLGVSRRAVDAVCQRARRHLARDYVAHLLPLGADAMACASLQHQLSDYGLGLASDGNGELLQSHLDHCSACAARVDAVRRLPEQLPAVTAPAAVGAWKLLASLFISGGAAGVSAVGVACVVVLAPVVAFDQPFARTPVSLEGRADASLDGAVPDATAVPSSLRAEVADGAAAQGDRSPLDSIAATSPAAETATAETATGLDVTLPGVDVEVSPTGIDVDVSAGPVGVSIAPEVSLDPGAGTVQASVPLVVTTPITTIAVDIGAAVSDEGVDVHVSTNLTVPLLEVPLPTVSIVVTLPTLPTPTVTLPDILRF